jgi:hypothetical protein
LVKPVRVCALRKTAADRERPLVRTTRRGSTVVDVADNQVTAVLPALRRLLADPVEGQDNLFVVAVDLGDDGEVDPVLLAGETQARSPRCQPTVVGGHPLTFSSLKPGARQ